jgi:hypothetical protein
VGARQAARHQAELEAVVGPLNAYRLRLEAKRPRNSGAKIGDVALCVPTRQEYDPGSAAGTIPYGLMSLWDMINFHLDGIMTAIEFVRQHIGICMAMTHNGKAGDTLDQAYKDAVENNLQWVHKKCGDHLLSAAEDRVVRIWNIWLNLVTFGQLALELKPLLEALEDDLRKQFFYHYPRRKALMVLRVPGDWAAALGAGAFPSIRTDIDSGLDCYAIGHYPASIFQMMRVAEIGMRALAREREVSFPKHPLEWAEWENIIDQIESKARAATAGKSRGPERDAARSFYTAAVAQLRAFKEIRNRIMHGRGCVDELDAQRAINQVRDFMNGLSAKIGEKTRRPIRRWP